MASKFNLRQPDATERLAIMAMVQRIGPVEILRVMADGVEQMCEGDQEAADFFPGRLRRVATELDRAESMRRTEPNDARTSSADPA